MAVKRCSMINPHYDYIQFVAGNNNDEIVSMLKKCNTVKQDTIFDNNTEIIFDGLNNLPDGDLEQSTKGFVLYDGDYLLINIVDLVSIINEVTFRHLYKSLKYYD